MASPRPPVAAASSPGGSGQRRSPPCKRRLSCGLDEEDVKLTRQEIFNIIKHRLKDGLSEIILYLEEQLSGKISRPLHIPEDMRGSLSALFCQMRTRWQKANRTEGPFLKQNNEWLNAPVSFPVPIISGNHRAGCDQPSTSTSSGRPRCEDFESLSPKSKCRRTQAVRETMTPQELPYSTQTSPRAAGKLDALKLLHEITTSPSRAYSSGRPRCEDFESLSPRSKRRRTQAVRETLTPQELSYATQMSLRAAGKLEASKLIHEITTSPSRASDYRHAIKSIATSEKTLSADAALSMYAEYKFTRNQYQGLRMTSLENNCKLYPSYKKVAEAKKRCYPPNTSLIITENLGEVRLQALLDHTTDRVLLCQEEIIRTLDQAIVSHMKFIFKWGCDGSSGQSEYKQRFEDERVSDANVFFTSVVPLQLISVDPQSEAEVVIWKNPRPSSARFCRPVRLQFVHENVESVVSEVQYIEEQIKVLVPFENIMHGKKISVSYNMAFTMIDGKVCNAAASINSTQRCYLCGTTSKDFNNIEAVLQKEVNEENLKFGLPILHAWIRFFECCLHLSYKLPIKKWQARSAEEKETVEKRKKIIQKEFRSQLELIVHRPKPDNGNTNDGNTARRFFENSRTSALITSVDIDLIERFHVILQVISSGHKINIDKFHNYTLTTARKFVELYPWYYMPTSVHNLLIHSPQIVAHTLLPIGQLSEEAQEARNKDIRRYRKDFARKCSRVKTMEDVFKRLLLTSDPYISSIRKLPQKKMKNLTKEAIELLISPEISIAPRMTTEDSDVDSESEDTESDTD